MAFDRAEYVRVAYYYYRQGLTQDEIAKKMRMSRPRVNRILNRCRDLGIVKIYIQGMAEGHFELEQALEQKYNLRDVRVKEAYFEEDIADVLGALAADYLARLLATGDVIGFSRGRSVSALVEHMPQVEATDLTAVQLLGGWNYSLPSANSEDIVHRFAAQTGATASFFYAPALVHHTRLKEAIMEEPYFIEAYETVKKCRIAVVGVGTMQERPVFLRMDEMLTREYRQLQELGAVGEVCSHYFDAAGHAAAGSFQEKVISVLLEDYLQIPLRVGVAGGQEKRAAILGAVRGGYINCLVTDLQTAKFLAAE